MKKLRVLIVDDEHPARMELRYYLGQFDNIFIVGEAGNAAEAYQLITAMKYDAVFLDIRMPDMNGIELVQALQSLDNAPKIIFVSAYEDHAIEAIRVKAFDYILKPIEASKVEEVVLRLNAEISKEGLPARNPGYLQILPGELKGTIYPVKIQDIVFIYSERELIYLRVKKGEDLLTRFSIRELEQRLDPAIFFRSHRCFIVNINNVNEIRPGFHGSYSLIMLDQNRTEVPVSRGQLKALKGIFNF
ncbi:MAG: LytTR family DNA-binding domain-containing protein [Clostridia bacterium]|nr:LytTR family DNA-binding domain-containing protein [Clostridia bacterium]